jgi:hypothetical protein
MIALPISERYHCARGATTRANSTAARTCQHVTASPVVPTHKVGLDGVLTEHHRHRIVDMSGRNVPVRVHALQSLNQSLFECVDHYRRLACARLGDTCRLPFAHDPANNPECAWVQATARGPERERVPLAGVLLGVAVDVKELVAALRGADEYGPALTVTQRVE